MDYSIRYMTINDYDAAYEIWIQANSLSLEEGDDREAIERYLDRNAGLCFVAVVDDQIVGTVLCGHEGRRGILRHLVVVPSFRKRGIARSLITECLSSLAQAGITKCNTFVLDTNVQGRRFWEHMGWHVLEDTFRTMQMSTQQKE